MITATEIPDDWADCWRDFHEPASIAGGRIVAWPSWDPGAAADEGAVDIVVDPGQAFAHAHATTRMCLELLLELADAGEASGPLVDLGTGSGVLAIAAAKLGFAPVSGCDSEPAALEAAAAVAAANDVELELRRLNLREEAPPNAPSRSRTSQHLCSRRSRRGSSDRPRRWCLPACSRARPTRLRPRLRTGSRSRSAANSATGQRCCSVLGDPTAVAIRVQQGGHNRGDLLRRRRLAPREFGRGRVRPTFAFGIYVTIARGDPRSMPTILEAQTMISRSPLTIGGILVLITGLCSVLDSETWEFSDFFVAWGILAILVLSASAHGFFLPNDSPLRAARRDIEGLADWRSRTRRGVRRILSRNARMGPIAGLIVILTIYVMVAKLFL